MATYKIVHASPAALTITLAGLVSDTNLLAGRISTAVSNATDQYIDALVAGTITTGTTAANTQIEVWAYGSIDGSTYTAGAGGTDAAFTPDAGEKPLLVWLATIGVTGTTGRAHRFGPVSLTRAFGAMPRAWGLFVVHNTGANLTSGSIAYTGVTYDVA